MKGSYVWGLIAVIIVAAIAFYMWPKMGMAPAMTAEDAAPTATENISDPMMGGMWQSQTDTKFTREIRPDGVMLDRYDGDMGAGTGGEWSVVNPSQEAPIASLASALSGMTVVKVIWDGGVETTYFSVNQLDESSMTTTDLSGTGDVTIYKKVMMTP